MEDRFYLDTNGDVIRHGSDPLHSIKSGCAYLGGISENTFNQWLSQGKMRRSKVGGRTMVRQSELDKMIEDGGKSKSPSKKAAPVLDAAPQATGKRRRLSAADSSSSQTHLLDTRNK